MMLPIQPLVHEIDYEDPICVFERLSQEPWCVFLDSANHLNPYEDTNRYSYIAVRPFKTFVLKNGVLEGHGDNITAPLQPILSALANFRAHKVPNIPPFQGGALGYFSYDLCQYFERINLPTLDDMEFPDLAIGLYDCVISFDHLNKQAFVVSTGFPETSPPLIKKRAFGQLETILDTLKKPPQIIEANPLLFPSEISSNFSQDAYIQMVQTAREAILDGEFFEVNLSQRFKAVFRKEWSPFALYQRLRTINPAPFAAYLCLGETTLASASPERFIRCEDGFVETRPIKGTIARGATPEEDLVLATKLQTSQKDHAENTMIVDLMRNDLSRVCEDDSILVKKLCNLESFATVHHLVSVIQGKLRQGVHPLDLLEVTLPGGSITGAPKVRAMEMISTLEPHRRGPYCGSLGYISFAGDMDTSILIRTFAIKNQAVTFQTGGAIVLDSDPLLEFEETLNKAEALHRALTGAALVV